MMPADYLPKVSDVIRYKVEVSEGKCPNVLWYLTIDDEHRMHMGSDELLSFKVFSRRILTRTGCIMAHMTPAKFAHWMKNQIHNHGLVEAYSWSEVDNVLEQKRENKPPQRRFEIQ